MVWSAWVVEEAVWWDFGVVDEVIFHAIWLKGEVSGYESGGVCSSGVAEEEGFACVVGFDDCCYICVFAEVFDFGGDDTGAW